MIERILPAWVSSAEAFADTSIELFPEEAAVIARSVDKRRREFTTARACARRAMAGLGLPPTPIVPGQRGAPRWPPGVVGSITHCEGYRACVVARAADVATIGLDAEPNLPLPDGVLDAIAVDEERVALRRLGTAGPVHWDRLLFSAKESIFKAWYPLAGRSLEFSEAAVRIDPDGGGFTARLLVPGPLVAGAPVTCFEGRWLVGTEVLATAIVVSTRTSGSSPPGFEECP